MVFTFVKKETIKQLVCVFLFSRLDYCNKMLHELPQSTISPLQRLQNAAAWSHLVSLHVTLSVSY